MKKDIFYISCSLFLFLALFLPTINSIPYLDGNIDFLKSYDFTTGGFGSLLKNWRSVHPPLKELATFISFKLFGINPIAYNLPSLIFGISGIAYFYLLAKKVLNRKAALVTSLLLSTWPLYLANSAFGLSDFLLTNIIIISLYYYLEEKYLLSAFVAALCFLVKEPGILLSLSIIIIEAIHFVFLSSSTRKQKNQVLQLLWFILPFAVALIWFGYLKFSGKSLWQDWNFSTVSEHGSLYTILDNIFTLKLFNRFAFQNWQQLFVLNFNWLFWIIPTACMILINTWRINMKGLFQQQKTKTFLVLSLFSLAYILVVLSFQTYTIPRYSLPVVPFLILFFVRGVQILFNKINIAIFTVIPFLAIIVFVRLYFSVDPMSLRLWGSTTVLSQSYYGLRNHLAGNDGVTYNLQYNRLVDLRGSLATSTTRYEPLYLYDCYWLFPDITNDLKTAKILMLSHNPVYTYCLPNKI